MYPTETNEQTITKLTSRQNAVLQKKKRAICSESLTKDAISIPKIRFQTAYIEQNKSQNLILLMIGYVKNK